MGLRTGPDLSSIVRDNDDLQPSEQQEQIALEKSRAYWYHVATVAYTYLDHGLAPEFANPQRALYRVPKLQGQLKSPVERPFGTTATYALCSYASSTWRVGADSSCDAVHREITKPAVVQIGTRTAIPYSFGGNVFGHWIGTATEQTAGPNYLGILAIGWCYILSARLVEMQGDGAIMRYTDFQAGCAGESTDNVPEGATVIDVGRSNADVKTQRWWSAILAKREGWTAVMKEDRFVSPWTVSRTCETYFFIRRERRSLSSMQTPLSSDKAFDALLAFSHLHGVGSQFSIALTVAMSFPMHRYYGTNVKLPLPRINTGTTPTTSATRTASAWTDLKENLPYYMTLSCSPEVMISTLCGSLWEPNIPCNMVSQWLHPVLEEILGDATEDKSQELLALVGAIRRPSVSALWIGAAISGIGRKLLQTLTRGRPLLDAVGFPWTGAPQSFMDEAASGPYTRAGVEYILRPDVWRLLNLCPTEGDELHYEQEPRTPWEPCGASLTKDCSLRVTSHLKCSKHEKQYEHWNWELENGVIIQDHGFSRTYPSLLTEELRDTSDVKGAIRIYEKKELDPLREASDEASMDIFGWFIFGGEGFPPEKIYENRYIRELWDQENEDYGEPYEADDQKSQRNTLKDKSRFEDWLGMLG